MRGLSQDLRYALRQFRNNPGFAAIALITLALGIGANTAVFSLIDAVMLRTLPVYRPKELVMLKWSAHHDPTTHNSYFWSGCPGHLETSIVSSGCSFSYPAYEQIRKQQDLFSSVFAFIPTGQYEITVNGQTHQASGDFVSGDFFSTLGVQPVLGRALAPLDDVTGAFPVVVLSYAYWQSKFGADRSLVGKPIRLNGVPFTVAGIAVPGFVGIETGVPREFWLPLSSRHLVDERFPRAKEFDAGSLWLQIAARLKPGPSVAQAQSALTTIFARGTTIGPDAIFKPEDNPRIELPSLSRGLTTLRDEFSRPLSVLMAGVVLVLLVACANVAGVILARAATRQRELALRMALGAGRNRIIRQLLTESLLVAMAGGMLGVILAYWGANSLVAFLSMNWDGLEVSVRADPYVLGFTFSMSCLTGVLSGLVPAVRSTRADPMPVIKQSGDSFSIAARVGKRRFDVGKALVVAQVGLSIVTLAAAGLLARTLVNLKTAKVGFDKHNLLLFDVDALGTYDAKKFATVRKDLQSGMASLPGVVSASYSATTLLSGAQVTTNLELPNAPEKTQMEVNYFPVGPGYFETMRIPLLAGRTLTSEEFEDTFGPKPLIVNQSFGRRFFGGDNPVGRPVANAGSKTADYEIVGVVADSKYDSLRKQMVPVVYVPIGRAGSSFEIRTGIDPKALIPTIRNLLNKYDSNLVLLNPRTQVEQIDHQIYQERMLAWLSGLFGVLALTLACIGLYGLISYEVTQRTHEIGIRIALGASRRDVLKRVTGPAVALVLSGITLGTLLSLIFTRLVSGLLYGVTPTDPTTFISVALLLLLVALLANFIPACRAMKVDPMVALRYE